MKVMLVAEKDTTHEIISRYLRPRGFDVVYYRSPLKAMDNLDEIDPDVVIFSAEDFPRHWKPFILLLREASQKGQYAFILLKGEWFSEEEAAKAQELEVHGIIEEKLDERRTLDRLEDLLSRFSVIDEIRTEHRYIPEKNEHLEFIFTHPKNSKIVPGKLTDLSPTGASFEPDDPSTSADIPLNSIIKRCSLKIGEDYITLSCKVIRNMERMAFKFSEISEEQIQKIIDFVDRRAERELQMILHNNGSS